MAAVPVAVTGKSWVPTRKWFAAQIVALAAVVTASITDGGVHTAEAIALVGWFVQAATTYLVTNDPTPGGVPGATWEHVEDVPLEPFPKAPVDPQTTLPPE